MRHVLQLMRGQLDLLEYNAALDFVLMGNALYYLRKFPGVVHHPKEELLFELLLAAEPVLYHDIERLREQHKMIYELEEWLQCRLRNSVPPGIRSWWSSAAATCSSRKSIQ